MANEIDATQKTLSFFSDEVLDILFSDIQSEVDKECEKQQIVSSLESEQSVNLDDDELQSFLEQQKNCNTQKKTLPDLRTWYRWCKGIKESRKIEDIPPKELDRLLGHFYCKVRSATGSLYEPSTLTSIQRSLDRHLTKDHHKPYSIIRDVEFSSSQQLLTASKKMRALSKLSLVNGIRRLALDPTLAHLSLKCGAHQKNQTAVPCYSLRII